MAIGRGCIFDVAFSKIANKHRFLVALQHPMHETILTDSLTLRIRTTLDSITEAAAVNVFHNSDCRHASSRP